jgi:hypothetical protein
LAGPPAIALYFERHRGVILDAVNREPIARAAALFTAADAQLSECLAAGRS